MEFTYQAYTHQALNIFRTFKQNPPKPFCVFNKQLFQLKITHIWFIFFASQFNFRFKFELQFCILFATSIQIQEMYLNLKGILNSV